MGHIYLLLITNTIIGLLQVKHTYSYPVSQLEDFLPKLRA